MFGWFKRRTQAPAKAQLAQRQGASSPASKPGRAPAAPAPSRAPAVTLPASPAELPEVVGEGNTQADWGAWEDSMTALDSQMQGLAPSSRVQVRETRPSQLDEFDAFAGVRRKRDL